MKGFFKFIVISALVIVALSALLYKSTLYTHMARYSLNKQVLPRLENFLKDSYLYESSNIRLMTFKFNSTIIVKLKRNSVYNPKDTKALVDSFTEKYYRTFDKMSLFYYPLRTVDIKFILKESEELGAIYFFKNNELIDNYSKIREKIITNDAYTRKEKNLTNEVNKAKDKAKRFAKKAFGFINFGDPKDDAMQKMEQDPRVKIDELMVNNPTYKVTLGSFKYNMKPIYKNDQLYLINIVSDKYQKNEYDGKLRQNWQDIIDYYTQLHGEVNHSFVSSDMLEDNFIEWTSHWKMDKKNIQVGLSQTGVFYHIVVWISHDDYPISTF